MFVPARLAAISFAPLKLQQFPLDDLQSVTVQDRDFKPYTGGMRTRLCLTFRNGDTMLIAVKDLDQAVNELQDIIKRPVMTSHE
jgi:hypothetical protein